MSILKLKPPKQGTCLWILFITIVLIFIAIRAASQPYYGKRILIVGSVYQKTPYVAGELYKGNSAMATKNFKEAAARVAKFGTPVLITDYMTEQDYYPLQWQSVFKRWVDLAYTCQEYYMIPGKIDGMMEWMALHFSMKLPIENNEEINWQTPTALISQISTVNYNLLTELDTTKTVYKNKLLVEYVQKNNCSNCYTGSSVAYIVPEGKYQFAGTQAFVDSLAIAEANANKQANANLNGTCIPLPLYSNTIVSRTVRKNNCRPPYIGTYVTYIVPAGKYESCISQADAQSKAVADAEKNKQTYANLNGTCIRKNR